MKQQIPINAMAGGEISPCITCHYSKIGWKEIMTDVMPATAILEIEMEEPKIIQVGNYMDDSGKGFKNPQCGRVYSPDGIAPTLNTCGGGQREPKIMQIGGYSPISCAMRGRGDNNEQRLEIGSEVANCVTTVQKDSMVMEQVIGSMQANAMRGSIDGVSPCLTEAMGKGGGQIPMVTEREPCGCYDNQFGEFAREPLEGVARTLKADHHNAVVLSRKDDIVFKEMPDGNIHAYRANDPKKSTAPEWQITNADNIHPTITTSHEPKVLLRYRIRKLTPTECFRLMGVDDSDIEKLKSAKLTQTLKSGKTKEKPMPKTALYKMAGNSIVVDVLYNIFHQMFIAEPPEPRPQQQSLFD